MHQAAAPEQAYARWRIQEVPYTSAPARWVVAEAERELMERYGFLDDGEHLDDSMFAPPGGAFVVATVEDATDPVGGVGLRAAGATAGEVKRLWVEPGYRGRGLARALMDTLDEVARQRGYRGLQLATGPKQPEAIALYTALGWSRRSEDFAGRTAGECAFFFEKALKEC